MLEVQKFLRSEKIPSISGERSSTVEDLESLYSIDASYHPDYPELVQLKYSQIDSPLGEKIVQECRGLILNSKDNWNIVAKGYNKFFNYNEPLATKINWGKCCVQEKLDGSLIMLWNYKGEWCASTTGSPNGGGSVGTYDYTFSDLFWYVFEGMGLPHPEHVINPNYTLLFELTTPYNRIVVDHKTSKITLIGIVDRSTLTEYFPTKLSGYYPVVKNFDIKDLNGIITNLDDLDPMQQEGYVIVDCDFNRVKAKSAKYVAIHHAKDNLTTKKMLDLIRIGEDSEFVSYYPEAANLFSELRGKYENLVDNLSYKYGEIKNIEIQKEFALEALKTLCPAALFAVRSGNFGSIREYLAKVRIENLVHLVKSMDKK